MKINCPACGAAIPASDISLEKGWGKCVKCQEVFRLADVVEGFHDEALLPQRPFDAWANLERDDRRLSIFVPAHGMRAPTWGMLGFATFWLAFIAFWTAGALGLFGIGKGGGIKPVNLGFAAFSTPFWLVGLGMLASVAWMSRGTKSVWIDSVQMVTEMRCFPWRCRRVFDRQEVQCAREGSAFVRGRHGGGYEQRFVEMVFTNGSFKITCDSDAERAWMIAEINDFLQAVPYDAAQRRFSELP
jgi:hypothetical protein